MKVILSRKGFDHTAGGKPSPILPDGKMISFPIPGEEENNRQKYRDLYYGESERLEDLMESLGIGVCGEKLAHLDPDLRACSLKVRNLDWKPIFGQDGASASHLKNNNVDKDDLFLFFGWFKQTKKENEKIVFDYINDPHGKHVLFGYLQIGQIFRAGDAPEPWMEYHPHSYYIRDSRRKLNTIYVAARHLSFNAALSGGGNFLFNEKSKQCLTLTRSGTSNISEWNLPQDVFENAEITYHRDKRKIWKKDDRGTYFQSARTHWQEAVITDKVGSVEAWARNLISQLHKSNCIE